MCRLSEYNQQQIMSGENNKENVRPLFADVILGGPNNKIRKGNDGEERKQNVRSKK